METLAIRSIVATPADGGIFLKFYRAVNREALHSANFGRKRDGKYVFSQTLQD